MMIKGMSALAFMMAVSAVSALTKSEFQKRLEAYHKTPAAADSDARKGAVELVTNADNFALRDVSKLWARDSTKLPHTRYLMSQLTKEVAPLLNNKNGNDIDAIQGTLGMCQNFKPEVYPLLTEKAVAAMNWSCLNEQNGSSSIFTLINPAHIKSINDDAFKAGAFEIVSFLAKNTFTASEFVDKNPLHFLSEKQITLLMTLPDADRIYRLIDVSSLHKMEHQKKLRLIKSHAFAKFANLQSKGIDASIVKYLPDDILSECGDHPINEDTLKVLRKPQLTQFAAKQTGDDRCRHLDVHNWTDAALEVVNPQCFAIYLAYQTGYAKVKFNNEKSMSKLPDNIFTHVSSADEIGAIVPKFLLGMKKTHIQFLVEKFPQAMRYIPKEAVDNLQFMANLRSNITAIAFAHLAPEVQVVLYAKATKDALPVDILSYVDADMISQWSHELGNGMQFFEKASVPAAQMFNLGVRLPGNHPCLLIENKEALIDENGKKTNLMKNMGPACFSNLTIISDFTPEEMALFPEQVWAFSSIGEIQKYAPNFFKNVDATILGLMSTLKTDVFCGNVDAVSISAIQPASMSGMSGKCLAAMKAPAVAALSAAQLSNLSAAELMDMDATVAASLTPSIAAFTPAQLCNLSVRVKDATKSAFTVVNKEVIGKMSVEQVAALTAEQVAAIPAAAFKGLKKEHIVAVAPAALTKVTFEQVKECSEEVLLALSVAQINAIGSEVQDATKSARKIFTEALIKKMGKEQAEAAKAVSGNNAASVKATVAGALAAVVAAFALF